MIGKLGPKIKEGCNARFVILRILKFSFDFMQLLVSWEFGDSACVVVQIWYFPLFKCMVM